MPERPDYAALTRGQLAVLDRLNAGETGLPVVQQIVRLAQDVLGASAAGFVEYTADGHGRVVAATGSWAPAIGRRIDSTDDVFPGEAVALSKAGDTVVGSLHALSDISDNSVTLELLASILGRLYGTQPRDPDQARRQESRDLWLAVTSHELRTPVTVIKGYADTLTNHWDSLGEQGRQEAVRVIGARAGELARLVDRLLTATSDDGDPGEAPAGPYDLPDTLRGAVEELPEDLRRRIRLENLPAELPKAYGERESIATILTELATNAEKNSPPDSPIELCAAADGETLRFRVSDHGIGIRPEHVERAFERYWQAEAGDRRRHPGAGLGLYLVRRLVERQQGWVSLRPREGGGTTAEVRLPRA
ncbi:sensor histidine kinase [Paractinoplanes globisporus]|uniref:histidine kinase n=1 Tax=Paractinoplanes globisporus TaxID=113565 RepID=A0ABW6WQN2_9ACTN|nr:HAMP domain-containing sensor histidine kinase [Actinoplanes globisporus]